MITDEPEEELSWGDKMLLPGRPLSPRHKKLAELAASGRTNNEIAAELGYTASRVSILLSNTMIKNEIESIRDRVYEDTKKRLKEMTRPALDEIEKCLKDESNRYKENLKVETARWLIEKVDGRPVQSLELGASTLAAMMDRLDALKNSGQKSVSAMDVTNSVDIEVINDTETVQEMQMLPEPRPKMSKSEEDLIRDWATSFDDEKNS